MNDNCIQRYLNINLINIKDKIRLILKKIGSVLLCRIDDLLGRPKLFRMSAD